MMRSLIVSCIILTFSNQLVGQLKLPTIFSDNMVLQRNEPVEIWGWSSGNDQIAVTIADQEMKTTADNTGKWSVVLEPMTHGGPFAIKVKGISEEIILDNILVGDVWVCSGQSNMEWNLKNSNNPEEEIANSSYPNIRLFTVKRDLSYTVKEDFKSNEWLVCGPESAGEFSAVAYFFGRKLVRDLDVPIGLVHSSWGGTNIQTWTSWDKISEREEYKGLNPAEFDKQAEEMAVKQKKYEEALTEDIGTKEEWFDPKKQPSGWKNVAVPAEWGATVIGKADGVAWFRTWVKLPKDVEGKPGKISLGPIDDVDHTYINGQLVGSIDVWNTERNYEIEQGILRAGENLIVVKIFDNTGGGGIYGKPEQLYLSVGGVQYPLDGQWEYKAAALNSDFGVIPQGPNSFPSQLYNAMIAPMIDFKIKGAIWYQGESNASEAYKYRTLFPDLISNWRSKWGYEFPFYWVQLANYMKPSEQPGPSAWAELREAQNMTLSLPQTGQAVTIDIGEADDIHPRNKQDVGYRLALSALNRTYGKDIVYSGPTFQSMEIDGGKAILTFENVGSGLAAKSKDGILKGFSIAGSDQKFYWANARIEGNNVIVESDQVQEPVAVRYAWADNPDQANFYNKEGLPASPFRTDTWPGITQRDSN